MAVELLSDIAEAPEAAATDEAVVVEELLVEEISIDGMCGVY
jgi:mycofactocin precursor